LFIGFLLVRDGKSHTSKFFVHKTIESIYIASGFGVIAKKKLLQFCCCIKNPAEISLGF